MHELNRLAYLQAMGIESYVSRGQLAGAAVSQRLSVRQKRPPQERQAPVPQVAPVAREKPAREKPAMPQVEERARPAPAPDMRAPRAAQSRPVEHFSLAALVAGPYLWLEDLGGRPLAREQVQLVQGMALALAGGPIKPDVAQFDWPMHNNRQLDLGAAAASAETPWW